MHGTRMRKADLRGTDLSQVRGLTRQQISRCKTDNETALPPFKDLDAS